MPTVEQVYAALKRCQDPEIPINIVDLGLIYDVAINNNNVTVKMTLTVKGCHMSTYISEDAQRKILEDTDAEGVSVEIVWDPPWNPAMISDEGRKLLGLPAEN